MRRRLPPHFVCVYICLWLLHILLRKLNGLHNEPTICKVEELKGTTAALHPPAPSRPCTLAQLLNITSGGAAVLPPLRAFINTLCDKWRMKKTLNNSIAVLPKQPSQSKRIFSNHELVILHAENLRYLQEQIRNENKAARTKWIVTWRLFKTPYSGAVPPMEIKLLCLRLRAGTRS